LAEIEDRIKFADRKYKSAAEANQAIKDYQKAYVDNFYREVQDEIDPYRYYFFKFNEDEFASALMQTEGQEDEKLAGRAAVIKMCTSLFRILAESVPELLAQT
jgi:hypothetical protein